MSDIVIEAIKKIFGENDWLFPAIVLCLAVLGIQLVKKKNLPRYFRYGIIICIVTITVFIEMACLNCTQHPRLILIKYAIMRLASILSVIILLFLAYKYIKNEKQLRLVIRNTDYDGKIIKAWEQLQEIKISNLTLRQKKKYDKRRLYLRVMLGNMQGAEQELAKYEDDKSFYHYTKAIIFNYKGYHKSELKEITSAENSCNGDTSPLLHFQIIENKGVAYVGVGEYSLANDCYRKAIDFGRKKNLTNPDLWLDAYYNYIFNLTRLNSEISINECLDKLEAVKKYIDVESPKQYIGYCNIVIELMRQKGIGADSLDQMVNMNFQYLVTTKLTDIERCLLEATTARMVCTGRLNPSAVIDKISEDLGLFLDLPMPERYVCFKEIDYLFEDLRGNIVKKYQKLKETAHWYIVNQAENDLEKYRESLPSEAIYEICNCLKEQAGLLKFKPEKYDWNNFIKHMSTAQRLYKDNDLLAESVLCSLNIIDEALSDLNVNSDQGLLHIDDMNESLREVETLLPELMEHPILNEIYLRLSGYCFAMNDIEKSKTYYEKLQRLNKLSIDHFAPWLRARYSVISLNMFVVGYIETVDKISNMNLCEESVQFQKWFLEFHDRDGFFEAIVLGMILGERIIPLYIEENQNTNNSEKCWLVVPALKMKIKCNGTITGKLYGQDELFSMISDEDLKYLDINTIAQPIRETMERIVDRIKRELPDYLVSGEELNRLANDSWFDKSVKFEENDNVG